MPGLLDLVDDPNQLGLLSLGLRLMSTPGKFGAALGQAGMGALGDVQQARSALEARKLREQQMRFQQLQEERAAQLFPLQLAQVTAQTEETKAQAAQRLALAEEAARKQREAEAIRKLLVNQLMPTQPIEANAVSGITGPRPEALAVVGGRRPIDAQALVAQGVPVETVKALMESPNFGRAKVARTVEVDDGQGGKQTVQLDDYGNRVGAGMPGYIAPVQVNQGDKVTFARPQAGVSLPVGMSPDAKASNSVAWANYGLAKDRLNFDKTQPKNQYDADRGLVVDLRDGTAAPVMQGGQPLAPKPKDTPVEFKKSVAGLNELENGLKSYEQVLKKYGTGVLSKDTERAELRGAFTAVQMGLKNAMELGALAGPDLDLLNGMLLDPTSPKSVFLGAKGLQQQIDTARDYLGNRGRAVYEAHGQAVPDKYLKASTKSWKDAGYASEAAAIQDAQNAILKGADKAAVRKRLTDMGITNAGIN